MYAVAFKSVGSVLIENPNTHEVNLASIAETSENYFFTLSVPGIDRQRISLQFERDVMILAIEESPGPAQTTETLVAKKFLLPTDVDPGSATAVYSEGELVIRVPKAKDIVHAKSLKVYVA